MLAQIFDPASGWTVPDKIAQVRRQDNAGTPTYGVHFASASGSADSDSSDSAGVRCEVRQVEAESGAVHFAVAVRLPLEVTEPEVILKYNDEISGFPGVTVDAAGLIVLQGAVPVVQGVPLATLRFQVASLVGMTALHAATTRASQDQNWQKPPAIDAFVDLFLEETPQAAQVICCLTSLVSSVETFERHGIVPPAPPEPPTAESAEPVDDGFDDVRIIVKTLMGKDQRRILRHLEILETASASCLSLRRHGDYQELRLGRSTTRA